MLTMRRILVIGTVITCGMAVVGPAWAGDGWGLTTCAQTPSPACRLGVGGDGGRGTPSHRAPAPGGRGGSPRGGHSTSPDPSSEGSNSKLAHCAYSRSDFQPPGAKTVAQTGATSSVHLVSAVRSESSRPIRMVAAEPPGAWYLWKCTTAGITDGLYHPPVWIPDGKQPAHQATLPSPGELAQVAYRQLSLPSPTIAVNPAGDQLVNLPTWLRLTGGWTQTSATASVPGESVTATASPRSVIWSMGDGASLTCTGPGTPFRPGDSPAASSPDCGHTYRRSSAGQPGQAFPVTATVHWTVTWSGAGQSGVFAGLTTATRTTLRVAESEALNTGG